MVNHSLSEVILTFSSLPVPKQRPRSSRNGKFYTPAKTKKSEEDLAFECLSQMKEKGLEIFECPLHIDIEFQIARPKSVRRRVPAVKPDIDNLIKTVLDGLNRCLYQDDKQVISVCAIKKYCSKDGMILRVKPID